MTGSYREFAQQYLMIMAAPNGARRMRADYPSLPITPRQLAIEAKKLVDEQVSVLHLHVRGRGGGHSLDPDHYRAAIEAIRAAVGQRLVTQVTSESVGEYNREQQMEMVSAVRPEAVSVALRELCPDADAERGAGQFYPDLLVV